MLARAGEIKQQKRRENIIANTELARLSRQLVTLKTDTPIDVPLEDFELHAQDGPKLVAFLKTMEFTTLTRRVAAATETDAGCRRTGQSPGRMGCAGAWTRSRQGRPCLPVFAVRFVHVKITGSWKCCGCGSVSGQRDG